MPSGLPLYLFPLRSPSHHPDNEWQTDSRSSRPSSPVIAHYSSVWHWDKRTDGHLDSWKQEDILIPSTHWGLETCSAGGSLYKNFNVEVVCHLSSSSSCPSFCSICIMEYCGTESDELVHYSGHLYPTSHTWKLLKQLEGYKCADWNTVRKW